MSKKSVNTRIGRRLDSLLRQVSEEHNLSISEASDILAMEITGENLFIIPKKKNDKRRNIFG